MTKNEDWYIYLLSGLLLGLYIGFINPCISECIPTKLSSTFIPYK